MVKNIPGDEGILYHSDSALKDLVNILNEKRIILCFAVFDQYP